MKVDVVHMDAVHIAEDIKIYQKISREFALQALFFVDFQIKY